MKFKIKIEFWLENTSTTYIVLGKICFIWYILNVEDLILKTDEMLCTDNYTIEKR